jgi:hypothetical protein
MKLTTNIVKNFNKLVYNFKVLLTFGNGKRLHNVKCEVLPAVVTMCQMVNITNFLKDHNAFIFRVRQSEDMYPRWNMPENFNLHCRMYLHWI